MVEKLRAHGAWLPVALFGVLLVWVLSAIWNFSHAYILAGGDNPLLVFEGHLPKISGTALAVGLASVGSDIIKALGGFILVSALFNRKISRISRATGVIVAIVLILPTLAWSVRSATGMAALAFGDTIAARSAEKTIAGSVVTSMQAAEARLKWLAEQTTCKGSVCRQHTKEAQQLREQLKEDRTELRGTKAIGGADPGGEVIAGAFGLSRQTVYNWTVLMFIAMAEIISTLGFPALALATAVGKPEQPQPDKETKVGKNRDDDDDDSEGPHKLNGHNIKIEPKNTFRELLAQTATFEGKDEDEKDDESEQKPTNGHADLYREHEQRKHRRRVRRGRPPHASMEDGHIGDFVEYCQERRIKPDHLAYKQFCKGAYLKPMKTPEMNKAVSRYLGLGRRVFKRFFDPNKQPRPVPLGALLN